jgi:uncharacterized protein YdaU (DUF1376 family)
MSHEEKGLYITLLCVQWSQGHISADDITRIAGVSFKGCLDRVKSKFVEVENGQFRNERLESERKKQAEFRLKQAENGRKGGRPSRKGLGLSGLSQTKAKKSSPSPSPSPSPISDPNLQERRGNASLPPSEVLKVWNQKAQNTVIPKAEVLSEKRKRVLGTRLSEPYFVQNWKEALELIHGSNFLKGNNDRGWKASFDWFIAPDSVVKIMEKKYINPERAAINGKPALIDRVLDDLIR